MNKPYVWIVIAIVVILVIIGVTRKPSNPSESATPSVSPSTSVVASATPTPGVGTSKTYTQLVQEYAGRHIQFDMYCQALPSTTTYKTGTKLLFDNRSGDARTITIGGVKYGFAGYGYRILTMSAPTAQLPKTISLSCGASVNVGTILLQK